MTEKTNSKHTLSYCALCEGDMVICADCGNNCCNASTGTLENGERCGCDEAYEDQAAYWKDPTSVEFAKDIREVARVKGEAALKEMGLRRLDGLSDPSSSSLS
jgi:hypothetical protein